MDGRWRIEVLGGLRAVSGDQVLTRFRTRKTAAMLAYLAYYLHRSHPREALIELLWPDSEPDLGRRSLRTALASLRHQLEPPGILSGAVLIADRSFVRLNPEAVSTDVARFEAAVQAAERTRSAAEAIPRLTEAAEFYQGELLPGFAEEWIFPERRRLAEAHLQGLNALISQLEQAGDLPRALQWAHRAVAADPLREESHHTLIRLLVAASQPDAAARQYRELERLLREELGETPADDTRELALTIERGGPRRSSHGKTSEAALAALARVAPSPAPPAYSPLPTGTVTFLLTDIEGSTAQWHRAGDAFKAALASHHALLREQFHRHGGHEVQEAGDSFVLAFAAAGDALAAALSGQRVLAAEPWPEEVGPLKVRMALHTGDVAFEAGAYRGLVLHHAMRMLAAGHGGQILCSAATAELLRRGVLGPGVQLEDLGVYRLRDLASLERLFQVNDLRMARREFPPLKAEAGYPSHLPLQFTRFFGRRRELDDLQELLRSDGVRLVTLMGPGGSGKTRLAIEAAGRLVEAKQGAVWFVPLADLSDAGLIVDAVRDAMQLPHLSQVAPLDQVAGVFSRQSALLVLDNFEQLVAAGAGVVRELLERIPTLQCLVTSRQLLDLGGEREFRVDPLPTPTGALGPEQLTLFDSVRLFVDRAQAVRPDFQVTNSNAPAVAELCHRLEGIPLALELAAARARLLTPVQMLHQLTRRFEFLVSRRRDLPGRHQTLRAAIDWSYQLLPPDLQRFFAQLFVFRGGYTLEVAETVCEASGQALDYLAQLQDSSLVLAEPVGEEMRYRLLETLREYGAEQLTLDERTAVMRRHAQCFMELVEEVGLRPASSAAQHIEWMDRLEQEHDNLRAALEWVEDQGQEELALRFAGALIGFWGLRGHVRERWRWLEDLLQRTAASEHRAARAGVLMGASGFAWHRHDYGKARAYAEEAVAIRREAGNPQDVTDALAALPWILERQGDFAAARAVALEVLERGRERGEKGGLSSHLNCLGTLALHQGDYVAARSYMEEARTAAVEAGERLILAFVLNNLGDLARAQHDWDGARRSYEEGLTLLREMGDRENVAHNVADLLGLLAEVDLAQGEFEAAASRLTQCLAIEHELGERPTIALRVQKLAEIAHTQGKHERAVRLLAAADRLRDETRASLGADVPAEPNEQITVLRRALGDARFSAAWEAGRSLTEEQALAEALRENRS